jgi:hypothetical protein
MFSRDRSEPDSPKFVHQVAAGIIARAQAKVNTVSGSCISDSKCAEATKSASNFCSKLEIVSSLLETPTSNIHDADLKPAVKRIQCKIEELANKQQRKLVTQLQSRESAKARSPQLRAKQSDPGKIVPNACLTEIETKRVIMSELTKIPVKVLEKRLQGLGDRIIRYLSPERTNSSFEGGNTPEPSRDLFFEQSQAGHVSALVHSIPQSPKRQSTLAHVEANVSKKSWVGGGPAICSAVLMAIIFCNRIKSVILPASKRRLHAVNTIQRAYLLHFYGTFYGSKKRRAAFFVLVKQLRIYVRRWRFCKQIKGIRLIQQFLISIKLRAKFACAVKKKLHMVILCILPPIFPTLQAFLCLL